MTTALSAGVCVCVRGLKGRTELNGCHGKALRFITEKNRWEVKLDDQKDAVRTLALKSENLEVLLFDASKNAKGGSFSPSSAWKQIKDVRELFAEKREILMRDGTPLFFLIKDVSVEFHWMSSPELPLASSAECIKEKRTILIAAEVSGASNMDDSMVQALWEAFSLSQPRDFPASDSDYIDEKRSILITAGFADIDDAADALLVQTMWRSLFPMKAKVELDVDATPPKPQEILRAAEEKLSQATPASGRNNENMMQRQDNLRWWFTTSYRRGQTQAAFCVPGFQCYNVPVDTFPVICWMHDASGCLVWQDALDVGGGHPNATVLFHYTDKLGFANITSPVKESVEVFASLFTSGPKANAWYGQGVYCTAKGPDDFHLNSSQDGFESTLDAIVDNNFRRMAQRDGSEKYYDRVKFCVPIIVAPDDAYDVQRRETPEMEQAGFGAGFNIKGDALNEQDKPLRDQWVVRLESESAVEGARSKLLHILSLRADNGSVWEQFQLAETLQARGFYGKAEPIYRDILESWDGSAEKNLICPVHLDTILNGLGLVQSNLGNYSDAQTYFRQVLELRKNTDSTELHIQAMSALGEVLRIVGEWEESAMLLRNALEASENICGAEHTLTLVAMNNLALLLQERIPRDLGIFDNSALDESELLFRRSLETRERTLGATHPMTLMSLNNLGTCLLYKENYADAEVLHRRAFIERKNSLGADHPLTGQSAINVGFALRKQEKNSEAETFYHLALEINERALGSDHPETIRVLSNLGGLAMGIGKLSEGVTLYRRVLEARYCKLGMEHLDTIRSLFNLGEALRRAGKPDLLQCLEAGLQPWDVPETFREAGLDFFFPKYAAKPPPKTVEKYVDPCSFHIVSATR